MEVIGAPIVVITLQLPIHLYMSRYFYRHIRATCRRYRQVERASPALAGRVLWPQLAVSGVEAAQWGHLTATIGGPYPTQRSYPLCRVSALRVISPRRRS